MGDPLDTKEEADTKHNKCFGMSKVVLDADNQSDDNHQHRPTDQSSRILPLLIEFAGEKYCANRHDNNSRPYSPGSRAHMLGMVLFIHSLAVLHCCVYRYVSEVICTDSKVA